MISVAQQLARLFGCSTEKVLAFFALQPRITAIFAAVPWQRCWEAIKRQSLNTAAGGTAHRTESIVDCETETARPKTAKHGLLGREKTHLASPRLKAPKRGPAIWHQLLEQLRPADD